MTAHLHSAAGEPKRVLAELYPEHDWVVSLKEEAHREERGTPARPGTPIRAALAGPAEPGRSTHVYPDRRRRRNQPARKGLLSCPLTELTTAEPLRVVISTGRWWREEPVEGQDGEAKTSCSLAEFRGPGATSTATRRRRGVLRRVPLDARVAR